MSNRAPRQAKASPKKRKTPAKKTAAKKPKPRAPRKTLPQPTPAPAPAPTATLAPVAAPEPTPAAPRVPFEIDARKLEEGLKKLSGELLHWANKGRYTRVRFKFRGKQLLPDLPLAAVVAAEGLSFYWAGILRALVVNVAGGALVTVELVNDADKRVQDGRDALLSGDLDGALGHFHKALEMDRDNAQAHLNIGVALKLRGDVAGARASLERAKALDPEGPAGVEAERLLSAWEKLK